MRLTRVNLPTTSLATSRQDLTVEDQALPRNTAPAVTLMAFPAEYCRGYVQQYLPLSTLRDGPSLHLVSATGLGRSNRAVWEGPRQGCRCCHEGVQVRLAALCLWISHVQIVPPFLRSARSVGLAGQANWYLDNESSRLSFITNKNGDVTEVHRFLVLHGKIDSKGAAELQIEMDSVNSGIPLRDERMRS